MCNSRPQNLNYVGIGAKYPGVATTDEDQGQVPHNSCMFCGKN